MRVVWMMSLLLSCTDKVDEAETGTSDTGTVEEGPDSTGGCDTVDLDVMGTDPPSVGDEWTVWLRCDGATLLGTTVLSFDPPRVATVTDNVATFLEAGDATMTMQVGAERASMDLTIQD